MSERQPLGEKVMEAIMKIPGYELALYCFSREQRQWFLERDERSCQFPVDYTDKGYTPCGRDTSLEVHHVKPQRWCKEHAVPDNTIDSKTNGITLCHQHHQGVVHPDMSLAKANYGRDKKAYGKVFKGRDEMVRQGLIYWNNTWDSIFTRIIDSRNKRFKQEFPNK